MDFSVLEASGRWSKHLQLAGALETVERFLDARLPVPPFAIGACRYRIPYDQERLGGSG